MVHMLENGVELQRGRAIGGYTMVGVRAAWVRGIYQLLIAGCSAEFFSQGSLARSLIIEDFH